MARLALIWSIRLYTEFHNEITAIPSRPVTLLRVQTAGSGLAWGIHLYSELHHEITATSRTVALLQVRLELACSTYLYSELHHEVPQDGVASGASTGPRGPHPEHALVFTQRFMRNH
jgi:hypothetical protein